MKKIVKGMKKRVGIALLFAGIFVAGMLVQSCGSGGGMLTHKGCQAQKTNNHKY